MSRRFAEYALVAAIFATSLLLWLVTPLAGLWVAAHLSSNGLVVVFAAVGLVCPLIMLAFALVLGRLNGAYLRAVAAQRPRDSGALPAGLTGEAVQPRRPRQVLEMSLTVSVVVAVIAMAVWFLFFAHSFEPHAWARTLAVPRGRLRTRPPK